MKGVLLAGGTGSRLLPLTRVTNKHLLPVYNQPMIFYPLATLIAAGIKEILVVSGREHLGDITETLGSGEEFGVKFTFRVQDKAGGIAQALGLAENFAAGESVAVILGDNIFTDDFSEAVKKFETGAKIFLKKIPDLERFGVPTLEGSKVIKITEKPKKPASDFAVTGFYLFDSQVFEVIKTLRPSGRGELEITDVNNWFVKKGQMQSHKLKGFWSDAGTFASLFRASEAMRKLAKKS